MQRKLNQLLFVAVLLLILSPASRAQEAGKSGGKTTPDNLPAAVWADPGDVSTLDLFYGSGGKEHAPDPKGRFIFVKEDMDGTSPKFDVEDENGVRWKVKLGEEPQAETAATRLLWAAGYFVDEDYFLADFKVQGITNLHRGKNLVSEDGSIHHARFERRVKNTEKLANWDWFQNQCRPAKDLNGLRIMMALVNNWDLKTINNSVEETDGQRRCVVTDVGATFGKTGNVFGRSKSEPKDFTHSKFIEKVTSSYVDFVGRGKENVGKHIPRSDAKWLGQRLALLSVDQIHDVFRAGGYTSEEIDDYTKTVQDRIAELNAL